MKTSQAPTGAGSATPESGEARGQPGFRGQGTADDSDCARGDAQRKAFEALRARLAMAGGFALQALADGSFVITRWNLTKPLPDLHAVRRFAAQVGAPDA